VKPCCAACFERTRSAIAVFEKLDVRDLFPLETRQKAERRGDFLPGRDRFVCKSAEEGDAVTLLNGVDDLEVEFDCSTFCIVQRMFWECSSIRSLLM